MKIKIYRALIKINVPDEDARAVADAIGKAIDDRCDLCSRNVAMNGNFSAANLDIIKWAIVSMLTTVGVFVAITKIFY